MPGRSDSSSKMPPDKRRRTQSSSMPGRSDSSSKMPQNKRRRKQGGASSAPPLPPATAYEDVEISDEDVEFVRKRKDYVGFLTRLDPKPMTRQVLGLKSDQDGDDLETHYEEGAMRENGSASRFSEDPVDVLPVKTLSGELRYRSTFSEVPVDGSAVSLEERRALVRKGKNNPLSTGGVDVRDAPTDELEEKVGKKTKAERRKEAKQLKRKLEQENKQKDAPDEPGSPLSIVKEDLERGPKLKARMAEIALGLLEDPSGNIMTLKDLQEMCFDRDQGVSQLAMLSTVAIFKDLIPGYRIRIRTENEIGLTLSKEVRSLWDYETALLRFYQAYVQMLVKTAKARSMRWTALKCLCELLEAVPHFNFRKSILSAIVPRMGSDDDECRNMCCKAVSALFKNPGKDADEATVEAVQLIADFVRLRNCHLRQEVIDVFLGLSFDNDLLRDSDSGALGQSAEVRHRKAAPKLSKREEKKGKAAKKRALASQLRKEVEADFKEASAEPSVAVRRKLQTLTLSSLFETYFRILKTSLEPERSSTTLNGTVKASGQQPLGSRPLLRSCLEGLAKFSHLINVDFMADLLRVLQALARGGEGASETAKETINVWERMQCCTVAFKVVRLNMDALNIDLREFYTLFYNLLLQTVSIRDEEQSKGTLAQALQMMLWNGWHSDMFRVAAFAKRLSTIALHLKSGEAVAVLATVQQLLVRYKKCRHIVENNNPGSGPVSSRAMVPSGDEDPDLSDAMSTVLWELTLLAQHYNPEVAKIASTIASMNSSTSIVMPSATPTAAAREFSSLLPGKHIKRARLRKQPLSPFMASLEEKCSLNLAGDIKHTLKSKLFSGHFRALKACQRQ